MKDKNESQETGKSDSDRIKAAKDALTRCKDAENHNRETFKDDVRFSLLGEQWPETEKARREAQLRPCLTINRMNPLIRQVVNDSRQNKPAVKVRAVDNDGDPDTADLLAGLIRNFETTSNADVAYDTAVQNSAAGGFGYIRVKMDYAYDDAFEMDLMIDRVLNPLTVFGDPNSTSVDGSDWNECFVAETMTKDDFKAEYGEHDNVNTALDGLVWAEVEPDWMDDDGVLVAEWWQRKVVEEDIFQLLDKETGEKTVVRQDQLDDPDIATGIAAGAKQVINKRKAKVHKVTQTILTGVEIIEENEWPGKYIPIVPVYGEEFAVEGKRYFLSLIHAAKDSQHNLNFWRSTATELASQAPRVPWVGPAGFADSDPGWADANTGNHSHLEYDGEIPPTRQPLDSGVAAGAMQEAMVAGDDIKSITGIYDASLGARSNETSGKAIMARQREGDTATYHFIDNLSRSIRQVGRILVDLIPYVYNQPRIVRVLGEDGKEEHQKINQPTEKMDKDGKPERDEMGEVITRMHDLSRGKYDIAVDTGPSYTTRREEAAEQLTSVIQAIPESGPILADILAKISDWPMADEIAERFESINPAKKMDGIPPQVKQKMQQGMETIKQLQAENEKLKTDATVAQMEARADMAEAQADIATARAKTAEAQAKMRELEYAAQMPSPMAPMVQNGF